MKGNRHQLGGLQHLTASQIKQEVGAEVFDGYFTFTVVRNPYDRLVSQFEYTRQKRPDIARFLGLSSNYTFFSYLKKISRVNHVQWKPMSDFVFDNNDRQVVDEVFRLEHMREAMKYLGEKFAVTGEASERENATVREPYCNYYDKATMNIVASQYARDLELFGYTF